MVSQKRLDESTNAAVGEIDALLRQTTSPKLELCLWMVASRGFRVNNLFNRMDGLWQCNLRQREPAMFFEFAFGPNAADAVLGALRKALVGAKVDPVRGSDDEALAGVVGSTTAAETAAPPAMALDEEDLLG